jgi:diaminopimelate decarboxylase
LVARAGVALYRVGTVKRPTGPSGADQRTWLLVDGGLSDNPRPALYGARYTALPVKDPLRKPVEQVWIGGPYCESGDILIEDLPFPRVEEGDLIAVPASGAYQLSMASNYNGARRPAVVMLADSQATLMQRRETDEDLLRRDVL